MIEYISKWRVIETLQELKEKSPTYFELPLWTAIEKIRDIPAADVRERSYGGMYEDLIKRLRELTGTDNLTEFDEAADAIEELVRKEKFHAFLWNTIQPNEMEQYLAMYKAQAVPSEQPEEET